MQAKNCKERILKLKEWRIEQGLTVDRCIELCGDFPSESTIRKIFAKGSEEKISYRESTIAAIEQACLGQAYMPEITIPLEDVIEAQQETAAEAERLRHIQELKIAQQKAKLHVCYIMLALLFGFDIVILLYDVTHLNTGFFNANSIFVWCVQVVFLVATGIILISFSVRYWMRKKKIEELEQQTPQVQGGNA